MYQRNSCNLCFGAQQRSRRVARAALWGACKSGRVQNEHHKKNIRFKSNALSVGRKHQVNTLKPLGQTSKVLR